MKEYEVQQIYIDPFAGKYNMSASVDFKEHYPEKESELEMFSFLVNFRLKLYTDFPNQIHFNVDIEEESYRVLYSNINTFNKKTKNSPKGDWHIIKGLIGAFIFNKEENITNIITNKILKSRNEIDFKDTLKGKYHQNQYEQYIVLSCINKIL